MRAVRFVILINISTLPIAAIDTATENIVAKRNDIGHLNESGDRCELSDIIMLSKKF